MVCAKSAGSVACIGRGLHMGRVSCLGMSLGST